jgi:LysR family transcriptional regulator, flagellar master operon regulator
MIVSIKTFYRAMDIDLLKTFLEVNRTRHFGRAAENLFLTQSAVSARVRQLEETIGAPLFTRTRNDIQLTPAGSRLVKHAESILSAWNRARQDAAVDRDDKISLAVGGSFGLWDVLLQDWMHRLYRDRPMLVLQAEAHGPEVLVRKLLDGALDLIFLFEPPQMAELVAREVASVRLMLVSARAGCTAREAVGEGYIMVDWGTSFTIAHARQFPDMPAPAVRVGLGRIGLEFLLANGGAAYLAEPMVAAHLGAGRLYPVADAPVIERQVYGVFLQATERQALLDEALASLAARPARTKPRAAAVPLA